MLISPKYSKVEWQNLDLDNNPQDWNIAVDIFEDRMQGRFFKQIDLLDNNKNREIGKFAGFAIIALDCLVIETLQQFFNGQIETPRYKHDQAFYDFFKRSSKFCTFFNNKKKAKIFYEFIRCGLLHQAQIKKKSLIHIRNEPVLAWVDDNNIEEGILIQRKLFHQEIALVFANYCNDLKNPFNTTMRTNFRFKMDHIAAQH